MTVVLKCDYGRGHEVTLDSLVFRSAADAIRSLRERPKKIAAECLKNEVFIGPDGYEIVVERSSPNGRQETVWLWENSRGQFAVWMRSTEHSTRGRWVPIRDYDAYLSEADARRFYEQTCNERDCEPYLSRQMVG